LIQVELDNLSEVLSSQESATDAVVLALCDALGVKPSELHTVVSG
jgi:hypothetical protein